MLTDLAYLDEFTEGDQTRKHAYIRLYMNSITSLTDRLVKGYESADSEALMQAAHDIRPMMRFFGLDDTGNDLKKIEIHAQKNKKLVDIAPLIDKVVKDCATSVAELEEYLRK